MTLSTLPLALSMGEPAGIGAEIAVKAWLVRSVSTVRPFLYVGDPALLREAAHQLGADVATFETDEPDRVTALWHDKLPVCPVLLDEPALHGRPSTSNAAATLRAIDLSVDMVTRGHAGGIVTNPIHKATLYEAGFSHPGHTEYLAKLANSTVAPVMMLAVRDFRTVPVTVHMPLRTAIEALTTDLLVQTGKTLSKALVRLCGVSEPRITLAGLNPHAGEGGTLGSEEADIIAPAIALLQQAGVRASGPASADTMFHEAARATYDAAMCMYHDQALIPIKTIGFEEGVNCTLGLPFVRTSPDHGTALNIAGQGRADARSLIAALNMAGSMVDQASRSKQLDVALQ